MKVGCSRKLEEALAIIISCTRRVKRPIDLVALAENILYAKKCLGSLEAVGEAVGLSVQQLKDFLAVEDLCADAKILVSKRTIDSVDVVKTLSKLPAPKQRLLAAHFVAGRLNSKDVRVITTHAKRFAHKSMERIIADYYKSRDVRLYVAEFRLPPRFSNWARLRERFEKIIGKNEIRKLESEKKIAVIEITALGHKKLREAVRERGTTLRKFIAALVDELGERK